jgi:hypothetical protein
VSTKGDFAVLLASLGLGRALGLGDGLVGRRPATSRSLAWACELGEADINADVRFARHESKLSEHFRMNATMQAWSAEKPECSRCDSRLARGTKLSLDQQFRRFEASVSLAKKSGTKPELSHDLLFLLVFDPVQHSLLQNAQRERTTQQEQIVERTNIEAASKFCFCGLA